MSRSPASSPARHPLRLLKTASNPEAEDNDKGSPVKRKKKSKKAPESNDNSGSSSSSDSEDNDEYRCVVFEATTKVEEKATAFINDANDQTEVLDDNDSKRPKKSDSQAAFHRHQYLSIIQEEEEELTTPGSSRASSRPGSIYGFKSLQLSPESPKRSPKRKTDSAESVNSLLSSDEVSRKSSEESKKDDLEHPDDKFNKLQKQLSEIEKNVSEARKLKQPMTSTSVSSVFNNANAGTSSKFGNSMREMLKNVVSSQKNVLNKKVESIESGKKMFSFKSPFKSSNSMSKSNMSLAKSKDSLNNDPGPASVIPKLEVKRRSKSCNNEARQPMTSVEKTKASRWIGKNPFDSLNEKQTEVLVLVGLIIRIELIME